jgi:hypothetical protein
MKALLSHSALVDAKSTATDGVDVARRGRQTEVVELLLKAGADLRATLLIQVSFPIFAARRPRRCGSRFAEGWRGCEQAMKPRKTSLQSPKNATSVDPAGGGHFELALALIEAGADPDDQRSPRFTSSPGFQPPPGEGSARWVRKIEQRPIHPVWCNAART